MGVFVSAKQGFAAESFTAGGAGVLCVTVLAVHMLLQHGVGAVGLGTLFSLELLVQGVLGVLVLLQTLHNSQHQH